MTPTKANTATRIVSTIQRTWISGSVMVMSMDRSYSIALSTVTAFAAIVEIVATFSRGVCCGSGFGSHRCAKAAAVILGIPFTFKTSTVIAYSPCTPCGEIKDYGTTVSEFQSSPSFTRRLDTPNWFSAIGRFLFYAVNFSNVNGSAVII